MMWEFVSMLLFLVGVAHTQQLNVDYVDHQLLPATSTAHYWQSEVVCQKNFDYYADSFNNYRDLGGHVMVGSWADFQPVQIPARKDLHVADLMLLLSIAPVANVLELFHVQGDVAKANVMEVTAKAANVADPVRIKRKNILRYKNGEFRPTLCSPRLYACLHRPHL